MGSSEARRDLILVTNNVNNLPYYLKRGLYSITSSGIQIELRGREDDYFLQLKQVMGKFFFLNLWTQVHGNVSSAHKQTNKEVPKQGGQTPTGESKYYCFSGWPRNPKQAIREVRSCIHLLEKHHVKGIQQIAIYCQI